MASEMKGSGQDGTQYKPGGILLICTYPEEHGICGHVNNIVGIQEHFSSHTKCFGFVCKCGKQFSEKSYVCDHQSQCALFDCHSLTTTQEQEEVHRSERIKYIKEYVPPPVEVLKIQLVMTHHQTDPTNRDLECQNWDIAIQNKEEDIHTQDPNFQEAQEPMRASQDQKETKSIEDEEYEPDEEDQTPGHIAGDSSNQYDSNQDTSQTSYPGHQAHPTSSSLSPQDPIENPENFHDSDDDEYPIFGRPVTPTDLDVAGTSTEIRYPNPEDQHRAAEQLDQSEAIYENMDLQDETEEPAYGDPRFNEIVDYFPSTKRRRI